MTATTDRTITLDDASPEELLGLTDAVDAKAAPKKEKNSAAKSAKAKDDIQEKVAEHSKAAPPQPDTDAEASGRNIWKWVAAALLALTVAVGALGYLEYRKLSGQIAAAHQSSTDQQAAVKVATDYATKSLTYSYEDPDGFFKNVESGVSEPLKNKYNDASKLLKAIMLQAQVTSKGDIIATEVTPQPGDVYQVSLTTLQTTRNVQNPEPRVSTLVLQVTVNKVGDTWQVADIGPKTGSGANTTIMHPGDQKLIPDAPGAPAPDAAAPAKPVAPGKK